MEYISVLGDSWILSGGENGWKVVIGVDVLQNIMGETDTIGLTEETLDAEDLSGLF